MNRPTRLAPFLSLVLLLTGAALSPASHGGPPPGVYVTTSNRLLVSVVRVNRYEYEYTYRAEAVNTGQAAANNCRATVTSRSTSTRIVDGSLQFPPVPAGGRAISEDTFRFRQDRRHACNLSALKFRVTCDSAPGNTAPVADAGADQTVFAGSTVTLNGSGSSDADGHALTFAWSLVQRPAGSAAVLSDPTAVMPTFVADLDGQYQVRLVVNDGQTDSAPDTVSVNTLPLNTAPVADAGADQQAFVGDLVTLDGTASTDVDGDALAFSWAFLSQPDGSTAELAGADTARPTFTPDVAGDYALRLTVADGRGGSDSDDVGVTTEVRNQAPHADAGPDQAVAAGQAVLLDGSASSDPEGATLAFAWSFVSRPAGSTATLADPASATPGFTADRAGDFVVQLIVSDGELSSAPDTVLVSTTNTPPVADAGPDQTAHVGTLVQLDGNGSTDANGDPLAFSWSLTTRPDGSHSELTDPFTATPTLTPDRPGLYIAQLVVNDGSVDGAPDTVNVTAPNRDPEAADDSASTEAGQAVTIDVLGNDSDPDGDTLTVSKVTQPAGGTVVNNATDVTYMPNPGFTGPDTFTYTASDGDRTDVATVTVEVAGRILALSLDSPLVGVGRSIGGRVTLAQPAEAGGVTVTLAAGNPALASVAPVQIPFGPGQAQATFRVDGLAAGITEISAAAPGFETARVPLTVTTSLISIGAVPVLAPEQSFSLPVSITSPAVGDLTLHFASSNPSVATITPSVVIPNGQQVPAANPQVTGVGIGTTVITATAAGYAPDTRNVTVALTLTLSPSPVSVLALRSTLVTVQMSAPAPAGGVPLTLAIDHPTFATVAPTNVTIPPGQQSAQVTVTGVAQGNTTLRASAPGGSQASAAVNVGAAAQVVLSLVAERVGEDMQEGFTVVLGAVPLSTTSITLSVPPGSGVTLTTNPAAGGAETITLADVNNTFPRTFYVQGRAQGMVAVLTASSPGYADDTATVAVDPSGFAIQNPTGDFTTDTFAPNTTIVVNPVRLNAGTFTAGETGTIRGGFSVGVEVTSSNAAVGTIITSPITFANGANINSVATEFDPQAAGVATIAVVTPPGFETLAADQFFWNREVVATVNTSPVNLSFTFERVGEDLQEQYSVNLAAPPPAPTSITVSVPAGSGVTLTTNPAVEGGDTITFANVGNTTVRPFFVQGRTQGASVTVTASAPGYATDTGTVVVDPSGFAMAAGDLATTTFSPNTNIAVFPLRLNPGTLTFGETAAIRGGASVSVEMTSSDPAVGTIGSPILFANGAGSIPALTTPFDPLTAGTTTIAVVTPPGFETLAVEQFGFNRDFVATVTASPVQLNFLAERIGEDLQEGFTVRLGQTPPGPVTLTVSVPPGSGVTLTADPALEGGDTVTFANVNNTAARVFFVQGRTQGTSTTVTARAAGFADGTAPVAVDPSGFAISSPLTDADFTTNSFAANTAIFVNPVRLNPGTLAFGEPAPVRGGLSVNVEVTSSNASVGTITTSPITFANGAPVNSVTTQFDPLTAGTSTVAVVTPPGFETLGVEQFSAHRDLVATVTAPPVILNFVADRVGEDLQEPFTVRLGATPPAPTAITLSVPAGSGVTLTTNPAIAGSETIVVSGSNLTIPQTFYVQGRAQGATTTLTASSPGYADASATVAVDPSGFAITTPTGDFATTAGAGNTAIFVNAYRLNPGTLTAGEGATIRGGFNVAVEVTSSNPGAGTITASPLTFANGANFNSVSTQFDPLAAGLSTITVVTPPGFETLSLEQFATNREVVATVNP